jgi:hypothetical protein
MTAFCSLFLKATPEIPSLTLLEIGRDVRPSGRGHEGPRRAVGQESGTIVMASTNVGDELGRLDRDSLTISGDSSMGLQP